jgi:hypothetical protein
VAHIINSTEVKRSFITLGWDNISLSETGEWIAEAGIDAAGFLAFLKALIAAPDGLDDTTVTALPAAQRPYVEDWLRGKGAIF